MTCDTCKHLRRTQWIDRDGGPLELCYCKAIRTMPYRTTDYPACRRWAADPKCVER